MEPVNGTDCNLGRESACKQIIISFHQIRQSYEVRRPPPAITSASIPHKEFVFLGFGRSGIRFNSQEAASDLFAHRPPEGLW